MSGPEPSDETLREVVYALAAMDRPPCSPGEREAAEWIAERLKAAGVGEIALEEEPSWGPWPPLVTSAAIAGTAGALLARRGRGLLGTALSTLGALVLADEVQNGPRVFRRALRPEQRTQNVVAKIGSAEAPRTLVLLAHHDAAQTGFFFDQTLIRTFDEQFPGIVPNIKTQPPQWWLGFIATGLTALSALSGRRGPATAAAAINGFGAAATGDIWRSETVPGANDNLTAVACLVALAEMLREQPLEKLRVWLVSAGAEETLQDGIRAFIARHEGELDKETTSFLCLDTVGSPRLVMLEGEGPMWMEDYDPALRDLVADVAERAGVELERGFRARASTDAVIPHRAGYPIANLCSVNSHNQLSNYHLPTDTAENVDYETVADATRVAWAVAEELSVSS